MTRTFLWFLLHETNEELNSIEETQTTHHLFV